jgi:uncharacterized membrane protein
MRARLGLWWSGVWDSLWFLPTVIAAAAAALALGLVELDSRLQRETAAALPLAFGGGAEGARGVLSAVAGSTITVTGVVFSLTLVALQLASQQFSPRVLRGFTRDRVTQATMGVLVGTFAYSLLVLRTVRSAPADGAAFVPGVAVGGAIVLALVSVGFLLAYVHHVARQIQAAAIVDRVAQDANRLVERLFPEPVGAPASTPPALRQDAPATAVTAAVAGYLQAVDGDALFDLAERGRLTVRMEAFVGAFVLPGEPLATVWPGGTVDAGLVEGVRRAFVLGPERTLRHDLEYALRQLVDVALKAISPGINDPTTARLCVDRLGEVLVNLGRRRPPDPVRRGADGGVRLVARETDFGRAAALAFAELRHYGAGDPHVAAHLLGTLGRVAALVPAAHRPALVAQARAVLAAARERIPLASELEPVEAAAGPAIRPAAPGGVPGGRERGPNPEAGAA